MGFGPYFKIPTLTVAKNLIPVKKNPIIPEITRHQSFLLFIHVFITGTSCGQEVWRRAFAPSSHLQAPSNRPGRAPEATDRLDIVAGDY